jgi:2'-5' RNA ligase
MRGGERSMRSPRRLEAGREDTALPAESIPGTPRGERLRLFIALPVPDEVRAQLAVLQDELRLLLPGVRWVKPEAMHLTLAFLGATPASVVPQLERAIGEAIVGRRAPRLSVRGLGAFPSLARPRVVFAGLAGDLGSLAALQQEIVARIRPLETSYEEQRFHPHITLGRVAGPLAAEAVAALQQRAAARGRDLGRWQAGGIAVVRSQLGPGGSRYTTLAHLVFDRAMPELEA